MFDTTNGKFGPYSGQMLMPDQSGEQILRCMPEMVDGAYQGAATYFRKGNGLRRGNNRLPFPQRATPFTSARPGAAGANSARASNASAIPAPSPSTSGNAA